MQLDIESITKYVKCEPCKPEPNEVRSLTNLLDLWLPPILPKVVKEDFLEFFSKKITGQLEWLRCSIDDSFTSYKVPFRIGGYRGIADFIFWDDSLSGHFLERVLPLLHSIASCSNNTLTVEQFVALVTDVCQWANFPLTPLDIGIITTVKRMPAITIPSLARLLHAPYRKTRTRWKRLRQLNIFRITAIPNYRSLGLQPVVVELRDTRKTITSPYLISKLKLTGRNKLTLYVMAVPEGKLSKLRQSLERQLGTTCTTYLVRSRGHFISFTHYKPRKWNIDWRKLFLGAHLLHSDYEIDAESAYDQIQSPVRPYVLDERDKQLIPLLMSDARAKLEQLASRLGMSLSQISRRKSKLTQLGAIRLETVMRRVGLIEDVVLRVEEENQRLLGIVKELPQTWVTQLTELRTGKRQSLIYSTLPAGSFVMMRYYLLRYLQSKPEILICDPESGGWPLSFENYDVEQGRWVWQEPIITEEANGALKLGRTLKPLEKSQEIRGEL
jgi:DNA-binding Lrp family transcriptional regulator